MNSRLIGIAGGSGSGKSTACYKLVDKYPDLFEVINLDDYQKKKTDPDLPMLANKINWDHPDIIDWDKLISDINDLMSGKSVTIDVWSHRSNPDYSSHGNMMPRTIQPKSIMLLEGYLALYNQQLNSLYDTKYYLELDDETRGQRRGKNDVIDDPQYEEKVLLPMHKQFVEPTKNLADVVLDVSAMSVEQAASKLYEDLKNEK